MTPCPCLQRLTRHVCPRLTSAPLSCWRPRSPLDCSVAASASPPSPSTWRPPQRCRTSRGMFLTPSYPAARTPITDAAPLPLKNVLFTGQPHIFPSLSLPSSPLKIESVLFRCCGRAWDALPSAEDSECLLFCTRPQTLQRPLRPQRFSAPEIKPCRVATVKHDVTQTCACVAAKVPFERGEELSAFTSYESCTFRLQRRKIGTVFIFLISKCITLCNTDAS